MLLRALATRRPAGPPGGLVAQDYVFEGSGANGQPLPIELCVIDVSCT